MNPRLDWDARDVWTAAYLHAVGVPFSHAYLNTDGRMRWTFQNQDDVAFQTFQRWRTETDAWVIGPTLHRSYREMSKAANDARDLAQREQYDGHAV